MTDHSRHQVYYQNNKKKRNSFSSEWKKKNPSNVKAWNLKYYQKNREKIRVNAAIKTKVKTEERIKSFEYDPFATFAYHPHRIYTIE